jgi:hypothetical protein
MNVKCVDLISNDYLENAYFFRGAFQLIALRSIGTDLPKELCRAYRYQRLDFACEDPSCSHTGYQSESSGLGLLDLRRIVTFVRECRPQTERLVISCSTQLSLATSLAEVLGENLGVPVHYRISWQGADTNTARLLRQAIQEVSDFFAPSTNSTHDDLLDLIYLIFKCCTVSGIFSSRILGCTSSSSLSPIELELAFGLSFTRDKARFRPAHPTLGPQRQGLNLAEFLMLSGLQMCHRSGCLECDRQVKIHRDPVWLCVEFDSDRLPNHLDRVLSSGMDVAIVTHASNYTCVLEEIRSPVHITIFEHKRDAIAFLLIRSKEKSCFTNLENELQTHAATWQTRRRVRID